MNLFFFSFRGKGGGREINGKIESSWALDKERGKRVKGEISVVPISP